MDIIISIASVITALGVILTLIVTIVHFIDRQKEQDKEIKSIKDEQRIITSGLLACLKGLHEQGCNGPVTAGIKEIEQHLNEEAHR